MKAPRVRIAVVRIWFEVETPDGMARMQTWTIGKSVKAAIWNWRRENHLIVPVETEVLHSGKSKPLPPSNYVRALHRFGRHPTDPDTPKFHPRLPRLESPNLLALKRAGNGGLIAQTA